MGKHDDFIKISYPIFKLHKLSVKFFYEKWLYKGSELSVNTKIAYVGTKTWNELPRYIKEAQSLDVFKDRLKEQFLF